MEAKTKTQTLYKDPAQTLSVARYKDWIIAPEGFLFIGLGFGLSLIFGFIFYPISFLFGLFTLFSLYFFRNPQRNTPENKNAIIAPADGKIIEIKEQEPCRYLEGSFTRISIFMSPFNVHVNRIPIGGKILANYYHPGQFLAAYAEKASLENEQNALVLQTGDNQKIVFVQIAGFLARRIVNYVKENETVTAGQIYGLIRFGSRMDIYLPESFKVECHTDIHVSAGQTIIASKK